MNGDTQKNAWKEEMNEILSRLSFISFHNFRSIILPLFFNLKVNEIILSSIKCLTNECTHEPCPEHFLGAPFPALLLNFIYYYYYLFLFVCVSVKSYRLKLCIRAECKAMMCMSVHVCFVMLSRFDSNRISVAYKLPNKQTNVKKN